MSAQGDIERRVVGALAEGMPEVDLLELSVLPAQGGTLRLVVDHPDGVDHGVCADVTRALDRGGAPRRLRRGGLVARAPSRRSARRSTSAGPWAGG